jgi:GWxTD domain-containing protein
LKTRQMACLLFSVSLAAAAFGALSKEHKDFGSGPTQYLLTRDEQKQWRAIKTDEQAQAFIDLFWARRDPSPGTAVNEFRDAMTKRMALADSLYGTAKLRGAATDRGKVFMIMGPQTNIKRGGPGPAAGVHAPNSTFQQSTNLDAQSVQGNAPSEIWMYEQSKSTLPLQQPMFQVAFNDQYASNEWKMERIVGNDYAAVFDRVAKTYLAQPDLTGVPVLNATAGAAVTATTTIAASMTTTAAAAANTLTSDVLRAAIDTARAAKTTPNTLFLNYGEFVTPAGDSFVPVQLYAPKSAGLAAGSNVTFFGAVDKSDGGRVTDFEEPVTLTESRDGVFYARSLTIPPGSYVGTFGLASDGKVISAVSAPMTVQGLDKSAAALSPLMISNNVYAMSEAQRATDPFAFGGIKVVPKGDRTFGTGDDLWYFIEARNPGMDADTGAPKMSLKLSVTGKTEEGVEVNRNAPAGLATVQPLKGVDGHYAIAEALPLSTFKPGSYKLTLKVKDLALDKTYDLEESFRVVN